MITSTAPEARAAQAVARASEASGGAGAEAALDPVKLFASRDREMASSLEKVGVGLPCLRPIQLVNSEGEMIRVRCRSRRRRECPSCAALYSGDASAILRAGALDVSPGSVIVLLTLTAPSFGRVHRAAKTSASPRLSPDAQEAWLKRASRSRCSCGQTHQAGDGIAGTAVDPSSYDFLGQVAWNARAGRLWTRTATRLRRDLDLIEPLAYAGCAEWQARGAVHLHHLVRLPASTALDMYVDGAGRRRSRVIEASCKAVSAVVEGARVFWGAQVVAEVLVVPGQEPGRHARRSIGYLVKALGYVVKDVAGEPSSGSWRHTAALGQAAAVMHCPACGGDAPAACRSPRHRSLGYSGHALRKSKGWSPLSLKSLREARCTWRSEHGAGDEAGSEIRSDSWAFVGRVHDLAVQAVIDALAGWQETLE